MPMIYLSIKMLLISKEAGSEHRHFVVQSREHRGGFGAGFDRSVTSTDPLSQNTIVLKVQLHKEEREWVS